MLHIHPFASVSEKSVHVSDKDFTASVPMMQVYIQRCRHQKLNPQTLVLSQVRDTQESHQYLLFTQKKKVAHSTHTTIEWSRCCIAEVDYASTLVGGVIQSIWLLYVSVNNVQAVQTGQRLHQGNQSYKLEKDSSYLQ